MSDLPQGAARGRAGSTENSSGFAAAINSDLSVICWQQAGGEYESRETVQPPVNGVPAVSARIPQTSY